MNAKPTIFIIAGPNGAGKTTFAMQFLPREGHCQRFINADLIARGLSPFDPEKVAIRAGKLMLEEIARQVASRSSFALETTLSGLGYARHIPQWRQGGYHVYLVFLSLPHADFAVARVRARVMQGGHDIPEDVIRRRFVSGLRNLRQVYASLVNQWTLFDSSADPPLELESGGDL